MNKINTADLKRNGPICIDPNTAYAKKDIDMALDGYRLQQTLKRRKNDLLISGPINKH